MNARRINRRTLLAALAASALSTRLSHAQGFAGLGADAGTFANVVPGVTLTFPRDHGPHPDFRIEWWYVTANLKDASGNAWGVQWTLFRQAMTPGPQGEGWANQQIWMGHAAVTSARLHRSAERFARGGIGQASVDSAPFHAWIDNWHMRGTPQTSAQTLAPCQLHADGKGFSYTLNLAATQNLVLQGDGGYSRKSDHGQASYYYSQPYFTADGVIQVDGADHPVTGQAWMDREWSSQPLSSEQTGWDWFSLHLASGEKIMLFRLRQRDGNNYFAGNWIDTEGRSKQLANTAIAMEPTGFTDVEGRRVPTSWRIRVSSHGIDISTTPLNPQAWMQTSFAYWEGPIMAQGSHTATGYLEMTGY